MTQVGGGVLVVVLVSGCAAGAPGGDSVTEASATGAESPDAGEATDGPGGGLERADIIGTLGGDPQLEGGCAWIDAEDGERYEVVYPNGWHVDQDPLRLIDPDGEVAAQAGDRIGLVGAVDAAMASICQIGPIFVATEVLAED
ncbi:MAG: hypothetical protein ABR509_07080 [Candidatus Limnocylindria bacterium]